MISYCSDRRVGNDDDADADLMQVEVDSAAEPTIIDEDSEGSRDGEREKDSQLNSDSDANLSDIDKEVERVVDSFDDDVELGTV